MFKVNFLNKVAGLRSATLIVSGKQSAELALFSENSPSQIFGRVQNVTLCFWWLQLRQKKEKYFPGWKYFGLEIFLVFNELMMIEKINRGFHFHKNEHREF